MIPFNNVLMVFSCAPFSLRSASRLFTNKCGTFCGSLVGAVGDDQTSWVNRSVPVLEHVWELIDPYELNCEFRKLHFSSY